MTMEMFLDLLYLWVIGIITINFVWGFSKVFFDAYKKFKDLGSKTKATFLSLLVASLVTAVFILIAAVVLIGATFIPIMVGSSITRIWGVF